MVADGTMSSWVLGERIGRINWLIAFVRFFVVVMPIWTSVWEALGK